MKIQFQDRIVSFDDINDYTDIEYFNQSNDVLDYDENDTMHVILPSEGIDDIISYLHSDEPWTISITQNHIDIVRYLGLKNLQWMVDEYIELTNGDDFDIEVEGNMIHIIDENRRRCASRTFNHKIIHSFIQDNIIHVMESPSRISLYIHILNYRLESLHKIHDLDVKFPVEINPSVLQTEEDELIFRHKNLIVHPYLYVIDLITGNYGHISCSGCYNKELINIDKKDDHIDIEYELDCYSDYDSDDNYIPRYQDKKIFRIDMDAKVSQLQ